MVNAAWLTEDNPISKKIQPDDNQKFPAQTHKREEDGMTMRRMDAADS